MQKKIGLVTCFINNYGACLQAYALQTVLKEYAEQVDVIQYLEPAGYDNSSFLRRIIINPVVKKVVGVFLPDYRHKQSFRIACNSFKKQYLRFGKQKYYSYEELKSNSPDYDVFVCGSDQIWNPTFYGGPNKAYYLDFVENKKRIAYAPSIGVSELEEQYRRDFVEMVKKFDFLSVREKTGSFLIEKYCNRIACTVLDPTLLISGEAWRRRAEDAQLQIDEKYIFCYLFGDRPFYYDYIKYVSNKMNLPVYIVPFTANHMNAGFHNIFGAGPLEFVKLIRDAAFVITDSFHATAFSINMNVPFYSLLRSENATPNNMNSRIYDILSLTGLEERLWQDNQGMDKFSDVICWDDSNTILVKNRNESRAYLENALSA